MRQARGKAVQGRSALFGSDESYAGSVSISQEEFESIVQEVAKSRFMEVTVSGFKISMQKVSRSGRTKYTVEAVYDPAADHWSIYDWKGGGTFNGLIYNINRVMDS